MDDTTFGNVMLEFINYYNPRNKDGFKALRPEYWKAMKWVLDKDIPRLKTEIYRTCDFMPKISDIYKAVKPLLVFPDKKKHQDDLDYTVCFQPECKKPVYNPSVDPYLCEVHYNRDREYVGSINTGFEPVTLKGSSPLDDTIKRIKDGL